MAKKERIKKGKKKRKPKKSSERWKKYKITGEKVERPRFCPRCGPGVFLAETKDRFYCGRCHYVEFKRKEKEEKPKEKEEKQ